MQDVAIPAVTTPETSGVAAHCTGGGLPDKIRAGQAGQVDLVQGSIFGPAL